MTTYADFQSYIARYHWREGDTVFEADLPRLIKEAEARIKRDIAHNDLTREHSESITGPTVTLPADYRQAKAIWLTSYAPAVATTHQTLGRYQHFIEQGDKSCVGRYYSVVGNTLHIANDATDNTPYTLNMVYHFDPVPYDQEPDEPFYDDFPDFYLAAVNQQVFSYLRNPERAAEFKTAYMETLESMRQDSARRYLPTGPLNATIPGIVW